MRQCGIRSECPRSEICVRTEALTLGAKGYPYLAKPVDVDALLEAIHGVLER
jgi:ActR/RegA family two-component response regulator